MKNVDLYSRVRHAVLIDGMSSREAARVFGVDPRTIAKMLAFSFPPGYRRSQPVRRPKLDAFTGIIDQTPRRRTYAGAERRMGSHTSLHDAGNRRRHLRGYHHGPGENRRPVNRLNTQPENNLHHVQGHYQNVLRSHPN